MKRKKEDAEVTYSRILDAGAKIFCRDGYAASRLEDIAEEAGVTRGAVYWHFENKADLLLKLINSRMILISAVIEEQLNSDAGALTRLRSILISILKSIEENHRLREIIDILIFKVEVVPEIEYQMVEKKKANRNRIDLFEKLIKEAQKNGEIRQDSDSRLIACGINSFLDGIMMQWLMDPSLFSLSTDTEKMVDIYFEGIVLNR